ncbi:MAG: OsmC family protein [Syntrophales bacterium]|nr:OsmC family protein [Syntrophales bacterium]
MDLISIKHESGLCFSVSVRGHRFLVDMGEDAGGADQGPSPAEILVASLGSCVGAHIVRYCQTSKIPYEGMELNLTFQIADEGNRKRISNIVGDISLPQDSGPRSSAVLRAGQNCIVRNTLARGPEIDLDI